MNMNMNMNEIISQNILAIMKQNGQKMIELANYMDVSKQDARKMLSGGSIINAMELGRIAEFLQVPMKEIVDVLEPVPETNAVRVFMKQAKSAHAKNGLKIADEIADMICFYERNRENYADMMQPWEA